MTYTFRNQFRLQKGQRLDADDPEITLADSADDGFVVLRPAKPETGLISQADELVLRGSGYVDADTAVAAGRKWRQRLTAALAREFIGVDFGPDDQVIPEFDHVYDDDPPAIVQQVGIEVGDRVITSDYRLLVFATEPEPKFIEFRMGTPTLKLSGWVDRLRQRIDDVQDDQPWDRQKTLAYRLVYLALTDSNPETQNIQLVTAIEVLLKDQDQPQPILDALYRFLDEVDKWPESEFKGRMSDILKDDKDESITRAGSEQVAALLEGEYGRKSPGKFFKHVYNMRSRLVHRERRGGRRPSIDKVRAIHTELVRFVLDFLDAYETG